MARRHVAVRRDLDERILRADMVYFYGYQLIGLFVECLLCRLGSM
jgi:hypothetical protein